MEEERMADNVTTTIDSVEALQARIKEMRAAQAEFAKFTQEQVDKIFYAAAMAANKARIPLAKMAVEETGYGIMEDKVIKNHYASEYIYNKYKDMKTCDVISDDKAFGYKQVAEPIGLVAAVIPTTNPTSTAIFKTLICLKTRNAILISPHPRAKACTAEAARIVRDAAEAAGCPKGIIDWIDVPSLDMTAELMRSADIILATGGPGMVSAAYSSGKPALGVGPGNNPAIIDDTADVELSVNSIIHSKTFDNGMICATEQNVIVLDGIYEAVKAEFKKRGCYFLQGDEIAKVGNTVIVNGGVNAKMVGQPAPKIAAAAGVTVPESTKVLIGEVESVEPSEPWAHEKLTTILGMYRASDWEDALSKAERLIADGGYGHTSSLFIDTRETEKMAEHAKRMKTCRRSSSRRAACPWPCASSPRSTARSAPSSSPTPSCTRAASPRRSRSPWTSRVSSTPASGPSPLTPSFRTASAVSSRSRPSSLTASSPSAAAPRWTPARSCG